MAIGQLKRIIECVTSKAAKVDESELTREAFLMVLSRATSADSNIEPVEVETVQKIYQATFGEEVSSGDVRTAAKSELFETSPLEKNLRAVSDRIGSSDRQLIATSLSQIIRANGEVSPREVDFFNTVAGALGLSPAELVGLNP